MAPPAIAPLSNSGSLSLLAGSTIYLGPNTYIGNDSTKGIVTTLPITTKNVLTTNGGLNINSSSGACNLSIDPAGNFSTAGTLSITGAISTSSAITSTASLNGASLNIGSSGSGYNFTVSDTGLTTFQDNLVVGSNFLVTKSTGSVAVGGSLYSNGSVTIGGTSESPLMTLGNDGHIAASNDLTLGASKIILSAANGNAQFNGVMTVGKSLNINSNQFAVDADRHLAFINCPANVSGDLNIVSGNLNIVTGSANTSTFFVNSTNGNINSSGSLSVSGNITSAGGMNLGVSGSSSKVIINGNSSGNIAAAGNFKLGPNFSTSPSFLILGSSGAAMTDFPYASYVIPSSSSNTTTTSISGAAVDFTSSTSQYLATQTYVDNQLWNQTVRINTILGSDSAVLDSFNNVYTLVKALEGDTTATAIGGLVNQTSQINETVSSVVANAFDTVLINCAQSVWADENTPSPIPYTLTQSPNFESVDGWWYKNLASGNKINWYLPPNGTMTMASFLNMYMNIYVASTASIPFITVYTKPKGDGTDLLAGFANAHINYEFTASTANKYYCMYTGSAAPHNTYNATPVQCVNTITTNITNYASANQGSLIPGINFDSSIVLPTDEVQCFCISTNSGAAVGNVEFILNSFNIQQTSGTTQMLFQNSSVASNYMYNTLYQKHQDFSAMTDKSKANLSAYIAAYNAV